MTTPLRSASLALALLALVGGAGVMALIRSGFLSMLGPSSSAGAVPIAEISGSALFFETHVRPILARHCFRCHGPRRQRGGLRLDRDDAWQTSGETPASILPGHAAASELIRRVELPLGSPERMPPEGPSLSRSEVDAIREWIDQGARIAPASP